MDGRPRPPDYALHTWSGFSTGEWDGDTLVQTATHLKEAYIRRWGLMRSDQATVRIRWKRIGDYLRATVIIYDPVYLAEPYIRTLADLGQRSRPRDAAVSLRRGDRDRRRREARCRTTCRERTCCPRRIPKVTDRFGTPYEARLGGAETMYPEYIAKMKTIPRPAVTAPARAGGAPAMSARPRRSIVARSPSSGCLLSCGMRRARRRRPVATQNAWAWKPAIPTGRAARSRSCRCRATSTCSSAPAATSPCRPAMKASCWWTPASRR